MQTLYEKTKENNGVKFFINNDYSFFEIPIMSLLPAIAGADFDLEDYITLIGLESANITLRSRITLSTNINKKCVTIHRLNGDNTRRDCWILYSSGLTRFINKKEFEKDYNIEQ